MSKERVFIGYHGTRMSASTIRREGLKPPGCINYKKMMDRALKSFKIERTPLVNYNVEHELKSTEKGVVCQDNIWMTTDEADCCKWAEMSPEKVQITLELLGKPIENIQKWADKTFGKPKCVRFKIPSNVTVLSGDLNVPLTHVPPENVIKVKACKR